MCHAHFNKTALYFSTTESIALKMHFDYEQLIEKLISLVLLTKLSHYILQYGPLPQTISIPYNYSRLQKC